MHSENSFLKVEQRNLSEDRNENIRKFVITGQEGRYENYKIFGIKKDRMFVTTFRFAQL